MSAYRGWGIQIKLQQRELPHFLHSSCKYLEGFLNRGLDPILWRWRCIRTSKYKPQLLLARTSTPCGVVSTWEKSVFFPGLLELMAYGRISGTEMEPYPHRVRRNAPPPFAGLYPPRVSLALQAHSQSTISHCEKTIDDVTPSCGAVSIRGRNQLSSPICQVEIRGIDESGVGSSIFPVCDSNAPH